MNSNNVAKLIENGTSIVVHSGNITNWIPLHKKQTLSTSDTIVSAVEAAIKNWMGREYNAEEWKGPGSVLIRNASLLKSVSAEELRDHQFTVKVFLAESNGDALRSAVETTMNELGIRSIHLLVVSLAQSAEELTLEQLKPVWKAMEELVHNKTVVSLGTGGLTQPRLQELYEWAQVKPKVNQVNLPDCCDMPMELVKYSKEKEIQLQTNNDEADVVPTNVLCDVLSSTFGSDCSAWKQTWISRYTSVIHLRSIVTHKGYLLGLHRT
ncbi:hypothetical protein EMCRGX_G020213 [Ephydatia muelleri]|eukprot:Em0016g148a